MASQTVNPSGKKRGCEFFDSTPSEAGLVSRPGGYELEYEVHGNGPTRVLCVIGYQALMAGWQPVLSHFLSQEGASSPSPSMGKGAGNNPNPNPNPGPGRNPAEHEQELQGRSSSASTCVPLLGEEVTNDNFTFLVFNNRGVGLSTTGPLAFYSTKELARDAVAILDKVGWTGPRSCHLAGISMGGMISQELAYLIPERFKSLSLLVTCAKRKVDREFRGLTEWTFLRNIMKDTRGRMRAMARVNFSDMAWLEEKDERFPEFKDNLERMVETLSSRLEISRKQQILAASSSASVGGDGKMPRGKALKTFIGQGMAVRNHDFPAEKLREISQKIPHIKVITGGRDKVISHECSDFLALHLGVQAVKFEGKGHIIAAESEFLLIEQLEEIWRLGEESFPSSLPSPSPSLKEPSPAHIL